MIQTLTAQQVADQVGVSYKTIQRWIKSGKVKAEKLNGIYQINIDVERAKKQIKQYSKARTDNKDTGQDIKQTSAGQSNQLSKEDILLKELERANRRIDDLTGLLRDKETKEQELISLNSQLTKQVLLQSGQDTRQPMSDVHQPPAAVLSTTDNMDVKDAGQDTKKTLSVSKDTKDAIIALVTIVVLAGIVFAYLILRSKNII